MSDRTARVLAVIGVAAMIGAACLLPVVLALVNTRAGNICLIVLAVLAVIGLGMFGAIKLSGRGFSISQMNLEMEQKKLEEQMRRDAEEADASIKEAEQSTADTDNQ